MTNNPEMPKMNTVENELRAEIDRLTKERDDWKNAAHTLYDHSGAGEGSEAHATYHNAIKQWGE